VGRSPDPWRTSQTWHRRWANLGRQVYGKAQETPIARLEDIPPQPRRWDRLNGERTGRRGYGVEIDPLYVDTTISRWERMTGWRSATISASREARDLKSPMTTHQIILSTSLMRRTIARFAALR
jgi:hypothetical protein